MSPLLRRTYLPSELTLPGEVQRGRGFEGGLWPVADRLQAQPSFPPGRLQQPGKGCHHIWVSGNVRVFTLPVLPAQSAQVPVLSKNATLDCGEDCPCQDSKRVFPIPKGQGGQMHIIARLHIRDTSGSSTSTVGASPNRATALSSISTAVASTAADATASLSLSAFTVSAATAAATGATAAAIAADAATSPTDQLCQRQSQDRSYISPTLQLE